MYAHYLFYFTRYAYESQSYVISPDIDSVTNEELYFPFDFIIGPRREKPCLRGFANNTSADQPAHPRSLISAFVIRFLKSIICKLATGEISIF